MKLITLLGAFFLITTVTGAYPRRCAKGPEYWCRDASTAKACGAVRHCEQTVWRENQNKKPSMTISETAEMLCNVLVEASNALLTDKSMKADSIKQYLRQDCTKLPNENNLIQHCEIAVDIYLSDILRHIQSGTKSNKICPLIQQHDQSSAFIVKPKVNALTSNATCVLCEFVIHIVEAAATANASEQELVKIFETVCKEMPKTIEAECKDFVDSYAADLIALLVRDIDPAKACHLIGVCPKPKNVAFLTKPDLQTCGLCDYVSTYITSGYPIENACSHFSIDNDIRQQCEILVHLYKPNICPQLPLCFPATKPQQPIDPTVNAPECSVCKFVVTYVDTVIQNNKSEAAIEAALEKVCTILPHALNSTCVQFVITYGPALVQLIEKHDSPTEVCNALKLCHNGTQEIIPLIESKILTPNSAECTLCKFVINYVEKSVGDNRSIAAIEAALQKVCNVLPTPVRPNCLNFVKTYGPIIAVLLIKNETGEQVCDFIKICNNGTQKLTPVERLTSIESKIFTPNSAECTLCKFVINYVEKSVGDNRSIAAIEAALQKVCNVLPTPVRPNCLNFVKTYGPIIAVLLIKNETGEQVCDFIKICNNGTQELTPVEHLSSIESKIMTPNSAECTLCKFVINYVEKSVGSNRSIAAIEAALEKVCNVLPTPVRPNCLNFVKTYGPIIAVLLIKNETGEQVCDFIKICNNGTQQLTPVESIPRSESKIFTPNSVECTLCEFIINYVERAIGSNRSEAAIEAELDKVCNILPTPVRGSCTDFVKKHGAAIATLLAKNVSGEQVCDFIKVCHNGTQHVAPKETGYELKTKEVDVSAPECSVCKFVVTYVDTVIQNNKSEAAIEAALEKVCTILPHALNSTCVQFVITYGPALVQLIEKHDSPTEVCNALKLCHNGTQDVTPSQRLYSIESKIMTPNSAECTLCKFVINYVEKSVGSNRSIAAIEAALEKVCNVLPTPVRPNCLNFVKTYGPIIAVLLIKNETGEQVCDFIKICNNGTQQLTPVQPIPRSESKVLAPNSVECTLCEFVINYVERAIGNNRSEAAIEAELDKVCNILPTPVRGSCTDFVKKHGAAIATLLAKNVSGEQVCDFIKVCHNGTQHVAPKETGFELKTNEVDVGSPECSVCKFVVSYVDTVIQNNKSEAAIEAALEKVCTILPHALNSTCVQFVITYGPVLVQLIEKHGSPNEVCNALKLCHNGTQEIIPAVTPECTLCEFIINYLEKAIGSNRSEAAIEAELDKVCNILPASVRQNCTDFVKKYGPMIATLVAKNETGEQVCDFIKICNNGTQQLTPVQPIPTSESKISTAVTPECTLCEFIINYLEKAIGSNRSEAAIEAELDKVCNILPASVRQNCTDFVKKYGPMIATLVAKNETGEQVCDFIKICNNGTQQLTPVQPIPTSESNVLTPNSVECTLCEFVINYVERAIGNNRSEAAIEAELDKVCNILPTPVRGSCTDFVKKHGAAIATLLAKNVSGEQVCDFIKVCHNGTQHVAPKETGYDLKIKKLQANPAECALCKYVVAYVDAVVQTNKSEAAIESALEKVCTILPHAINVTCIKFIETYGPQLVENIAKHETPDVVCEALKLCKNGTQEVSEKVTETNVKPIKGDLECTLCKYVVNFINVLIESNATEQEIEKGLDVVCTVLPKSYHTQCTNFVKTYGPILPQLIAELDDPNVVCDWLALCTKSDDKFIEIPSMKKNKLQSLPCNLCEYLVNYIDTIVESNSTEVKVEKELEKACKILPTKKIESECQVLVDLYATDLVKLFVEFGDPKKVCQELGLCEK